MSNKILKQSEVIGRKLTLEQYDSTFTVFLEDTELPIEFYKEYSDPAIARAMFHVMEETASCLSLGMKLERYDFKVKV